MKSFKEYLEESLIPGLPLSPDLQKILTGTKVITPNGNPMRVYHGTVGGDFSEFKPAPGQVGKGIYFTDTPKRAEAFTRKTDIKTLERMPGGRIIPAYLKAESPFELPEIEYSLSNPESKGIKVLGDFLGLSPAEVETRMTDRKLGKKFVGDITKKMKKAGYDSVRITRDPSGMVETENKKAVTDWIVFDPRQVINAITHKPMG
jgi:hypothetical protein